MLLPSYYRFHLEFVTSVRCCQLGSLMLHHLHDMLSITLPPIWNITSFHTQLRVTHLGVSFPSFLSTNKVFAFLRNLSVIRLSYDMFVWFQNLSTQTIRTQLTEGPFSLGVFQRCFWWSNRWELTMHFVHSPLFESCFAQAVVQRLQRWILRLFNYVDSFQYLPRMFVCSQDFSCRFGPNALPLKLWPI